MNLSSVSGPGSPLVPPVPAPTPDGQTGTQGREENPPPVAKYRLTVTITGNDHGEIERELMFLKNGGYLLDSDHYKRDEFTVYGGRITTKLEHTNPAMTPEQYEADLDAWYRRVVDARRAADRASS